MRRKQTALVKLTMALALAVCVLLAAVPVVQRYQLKNRAQRFAMAFAATTRSDVPVSLSEQIVYSLFYSAASPSGMQR